MAVNSRVGTPPHARINEHACAETFQQHDRDGAIILATGMGGECSSAFSSAPRWPGAELCAPG
jgi:hypothetical protein